MGADFFFFFFLMYMGNIMIRQNNVLFVFFFFLIKSRPFVGKQSLVSRYKEVSSGSGSSSRNRAWSKRERDLVGSRRSDRTLEQMPKPLTGVSGTELNLCVAHRSDGWKFFSCWISLILLSRMNDSEASATLRENLCDCLFLKVCVWSLISLKLSPCLAISRPSLVYLS